MRNASKSTCREPRWPAGWNCARTGSSRFYEQIRTGVMAGGYAQVDRTPVEYPAPGHGQTKQGYLWTSCRPGGDFFYRWETSRAADCLERLLPREFKGILQCDGYSAYPAFAKGRSGIELAGCWAHVRRKFHDALEQSPRPAAWMTRQIQHLYRIESALREKKSGPRLRQAARLPTMKNTHIAEVTPAAWAKASQKPTTQKS